MLIESVNHYNGMDTNFNFAGFGITTAGASVATTTMLMPSTQDTPPITTADSVIVTVLSQSIIIVVAVLGGVLVLIVFIVIASIVICCVLYNNKRKMSAIQGPPSASVNGHLWNGQLVDNPSYNTSNNDLQLVSNQSYNYSDNYINQRELSGNPGRPSASLNGHQLNDQLVNNPSYNIGDYGLELVSNQSYHCDNPILVRNQADNQAQNLVNDSQLVNNPAYNSNDQEDPYYSVIN